MSTDAVIKRLHVGGITPNISTDHLKDRFASFGKVHKVEELAPNALGDKRPFTFLTIEIQPSQLKKCMNIMSGSTWRGTQLKVAEAKPSYTSRLMAETFAAPAEEANRIKKRKRRHRAYNLAEGIGKPAQDMRLTTMDNYSKRKFWNLTPSGHLVRPLSIRPTHALPSSSQVKAGDSSKPRLPPRRARRRVINPSLWDPIHLAEGALQIGHRIDGDFEDGWEWHEADVEDEEFTDETNDDERRLVGWWRRVVDGEIVEEQAVRGVRRRMWDTIDVESDFDDEVAAEDIDTDSELFASRDNARADSPLFGSAQRTAVMGDEDDADATQSVTSSRSASPLFGLRPDAVASELSSPPHSATSSEHEEEEEEDAVPQLPEEEARAETVPVERSSSPLFAAKPAIKSSRRVEPKVKTNVAVPEPIRQQIQQEKSRDMSLLDSILGGISDEPALATRNPFFGGYAESDEDESEEEGPLRLRGGAVSEDEDEDMSSDSDDTASTSSSSGSSSTSSSDSDSDSDSEEESSADDDATAESSSSVSARPPAPLSVGLKDMFAPTASTNTGGFSLLASLNPDLELDELDVPLAPALRPQTDELAPLEPLQAASTVAGLFDPDPEIPLFFPTSTSFAPPTEPGQRKGKDQYAEDVAQSGWRGFWRAEDETDEMMKEIWEKERYDLTREWKKRHREAKKHRRRRGGVDEE